MVVEVPIDIYVDVKELHQLQVDMVTLGKETPKAISAAVNRAATAAKTQASKLIRERYVIKAKDVKDTLSVKKATPSKPEAAIVSKGRLLTLYHHFRVTPKRHHDPGTGRMLKKRRKVSVTIIKGQKKSLPGAWIGFRRGSGTPQVWVREGRSRYPVKVLRSLSVPQMMSNEGVMEKIQEHAQKVLDDRIKHEMEFRINKLKQRGR